MNGLGDGAIAPAARIGIGEAVRRFDLEPKMLRRAAQDGVVRSELVPAKNGGRDHRLFVVAELAEDLARGPRCLVCGKSTVGTKSGICRAHRNLVVNERKAAPIRERLLADLPPCCCPACTDAGCVVVRGRCHRCDKPAGVAAQTESRRRLVRGYPQLHCGDCGKQVAVVGMGRGRRRHLDALQSEFARMKAEEGLLDAAEAGAKLGRSPITIAALAREHGIGQRFAKLGGKGGEGAYLFSEDDLELLRANLRPRGRPRFAGKPGEVSLTRAAEIIGVSTQVVSSEYVPKGYLVPLRRIGKGRRAVVVFAENDVRRFAWSRLTSPDERVRLRFDERYVERHAMDCGASRRKAKKIAAAATARQRRLKGMRINAGRPKSQGPPEHHLAWATAFARLQHELEEEYARDLDLGLATEGPPTNFRIALAVAGHDFEAHPERWVHDPKDTPKAAAARVWKAVKPLLIQRTEIRLT